jgi:hypothetical protein
MTEVRPWIGSYVSVAQLVVTKDLRLVDCSVISTVPEGWDLYFNSVPLSLQGELKDREERVWNDINRSFWKPVTRSDDVAEYAPTQFLAEVFRNNGYDGVAYGSKLGSGATMAIFNLSSAKVAKRLLYRVDAVDLKFSEA